MGKEEIKKLLLPHEEYSKRYKEVPRPFTFVIENSEKKLLYIGTSHTEQKSDPQFEIIKNKWVEFFEINNKNNSVVVIESTAQAANEKGFENEELAIEKAGEAGLVNFLARKEGLEIICPEPNRDEILNELLKEFFIEEIALKYFVWAMDHWARRVREKAGRDDLEKELDGSLGFLKHRPEWKDFDFSVEHFKEIFPKYYSRELDIYDQQFFNSASNPNRIEFISNKVNMVASEIRDIAIVSKILELWGQGKNIFVIYGQGHAIIEEPALKALLK